MEAPVSRTKLLQEIRKMRFEEAYVGWQEKRLTQEQAAEILGVTDRSFRRYAARYEAEGVYSKSVQVPLKIAGFAEDYTDFSGAESYQDWKFVSKLP